MPITYDISNDTLYLRGVSDSRRALVKKALLNQKLTAEQIAEVIHVSIDYVLGVHAELARD